MVTILPPAQKKPSFSSMLGAALGGGMQKGLDYASQLGLEKAKKQYEMDLYKSFMGEEEAPKGDFQTQIMKSRAQEEVSPERGEIPGETVEEGPRAQKEAKKPVEKISGFDFEPGELPKKTKKIPPVGPMAKAAEIQDKTLREYRKENNEYAKPYQNLTELKENVHFAKEAKELIDKGNVNPGFMRSAALVLSEGKLGHVVGEKLKKLATTADEQKLQALIMRFARPKDIGGSNPSTREVLLALERYPDILNSPAANKFLIDEMVRHADVDLKKGQLVAGLKKWDPHMEPGVFQDLVNSKIEEYSQSLPQQAAIEYKETLPWWHPRAHLENR